MRFRADKSRKSPNPSIVTMSDPRFYRRVRKILRQPASQLLHRRPEDVATQPIAAGSVKHMGFAVARRPPP
jgi:hypothetical protein